MTEFYFSVSAFIISTHTPVRVWLSPNRRRRAGLYFNSHTREGVTTFLLIINQSVYVFQLTHPWGCDYTNGWNMIYQLKISTHTPVRVWHSVEADTALSITISTHTPVRVWPCPELDGHKHQISTHTPVRVWHLSDDIYNLLIISTHTPVRVWLLR